MPIQYARDDAHRRLMVTVEGPFQRSEILTVIERQRTEDTWSYGLLYDLRRATGHPTLAELREIMDDAAAWRAAEGSRGPVALLATEPIMYGRLCTYAALGQSKLTIQVFRDLDQADAWLAAATTK